MLADMKLSASCPTDYKKPQATPDFSGCHTKYSDTLTTCTRNLFLLQKKAIKILMTYRKISQQWRLSFVGLGGIISFGQNVLNSVIYVKKSITMYQCIIILSWKKYALQEYSNWSPVSKEVPNIALTLYKELQNLQKSEVYRFAYL